MHCLFFLLSVILYPIVSGIPSFPPSLPLAPANPASIVTWGPARFTILTGSLFRLELAGRNGFDDRPSLAILERNLPVPAYQVRILNSTTVQITTTNLTLLFTNPGGNTSSLPNSTCSNPRNADIADGYRVPSYPFGANVTDQGGCCNLCDNDLDCNVWIFDPSTNPVPQPNCWLMEGVTQLNPSSGRVSGGILPFQPNTLQITNTNSSSSPSVFFTWIPGATDPLNLGGVFHALDCYDTTANCIASYNQSILPGLVSRNGWYLLDDTNAARLVYPNSSLGNSPLPYWYVNSTSDLRPAADYYFFGHGLNYRAAINDFIQLSGAPLMPPASFAGITWSHWQAFSETEFVTDILQSYADYNLPLNQVVLDVDWHTEPSNPLCYNYGGFTVNTTLWPDWTGFISSLHDGTNPTGNPLKLLLNLHPQGGTDICQTNWPAFAALVGTDNIINGTTVACSFGNQVVANAAFEAFMDTDPLQEVDAWWTDFDYMGDCTNAPTASTTSSYPGIAWSNEVFGFHQEYARGRRPLVLSRSGGLGAHRAPVSFSGDANQHQDILEQELKMVPPSANALHAYWSHDIGGFMCYSIPNQDCDGDPTQPVAGPLYLRWIQAGVVWPILRTHASHWGAMERRIWMFSEYFTMMADSFRLRNTLGPYLYSLYRKTYDTGIAPIYPLYYNYPELEQSYTYNTQHMLGDYVLASPIFDINGSVTVNGLVGNFKDVFLPPGLWSNWNGTQLYNGPIVVSNVFYSLADIPIFVQGGCPLPTKTMNSVTEVAVDPLVVMVYPSTGTTVCSDTLYEDDGNTNAYRTNAYGFTGITVQNNNSTQIMCVTINPRNGTYTGALYERTLILLLVGYSSYGKVTDSSITVNNLTVNPIPFQSLEPGMTTGYFVIPDSNHTLSTPSGSLAISLGIYAVDTVVTTTVQY